MNILKKIMKIISLILLASTIICGYYIHTSKAALADYNGSVGFHASIAILAAIFVTITFLLPNQKVHE